MKILDLFAGLGGWSQAFKERGHEVTTLEFDPKFKPDLCMDILNVKSIDALGDFDIVLASPPCTAFSIAAAWKHHWKNIGGVYTAQTKQAEEALKIASHTFWLLENTYSGKFYVVENPRGFMRCVFGKPKVGTSFAAYQSEEERESTRSAFHDKRKPSYKPTDLWGKIPDSFVVKQAKKEDRDKWIVKDKHGLHGIRDPALRAKIPYGLSLEMCLATERDLSR